MVLGFIPHDGISALRGSDQSVLSLHTVRTGKQHSANLEEAQTDSDCPAWLLYEGKSDGKAYRLLPGDWLREGSQGVWRQGHDIRGLGGAKHTCDVS